MKIRNQFSWQSFQATPVIGIIRNLSSEIIEKIAPLCQKAGLATLEITMNTDDALQIIKSLSLQYPGLNIGAGTVLEMVDLKHALDAGASFIVTPVFNEEVITYCVRNEIPVFPGALTPTEIYKAWKLGASAVKVFPASQFGPSYLKELQGPLGQIKLLPTGGISLENIEPFFKAGAKGVGMGSTLFNKNFLLERDFERLYLHFEDVVSRVRSFSNTTEW
ncbi:MAG: bifunctional 4-hydroxy-2-oxoglutarate aldolase/2-dehydro-3-deoxy-phosphogluconate aldolase [Ginsengibacter sp.]